MELSWQTEMTMRERCHHQRLPLQLMKRIGSLKASPMRSGNGHEDSDLDHPRLLIVFQLVEQLHQGYDQEKSDYVGQRLKMMFHLTSIIFHSSSCHQPFHLDDLLYFDSPFECLGSFGPFLRLLFFFRIRACVVLGLVTCRDGMELGSLRTSVLKRSPCTICRLFHCIRSKHC